MGAHNPKRALLFYLVLAAALLVFQELVFRLVFPWPEVEGFNRVNYSMLFQAEPGGAARPLANASFSWASDPDGAEYVHHLNLYGFRDRTWPLASGGARVMFIGDSFVEGFMAADDETIPRSFEEASLDDGKPVSAMNLGVGASGVEQYLALIRDALPLFRPDTVVLVLYANDFAGDRDAAEELGRAAPPLRPEPFVPRLLAVVRALARGDGVATRWPKKPFAFLPAAGSDRSPLHDRDFAERAGRFVEPEILAAMQQGRFNPFVINEYTNYREFLTSPTGMPDIIGPLQRFVEASGSGLLVVHIPYKSQVSDAYLDFAKRYDEDKQPASLMAERYQDHAAQLRAACERLGVAFLDTAALLRAREARGERMYWSYDEHMKAAAYRLIGRQVYEFWDSAGRAGDQLAGPG